ncbi:MAG: pyruvate dehydrogenase (acetyl-transferring) E1 component subunit alpha [Actinomycetota bacterium]
MTTIAGPDIPHTRFIAPDGRAERDLPEFARDPEALIPLYRAMVRCRTLDARAVALHRTGRLGTYASCLGQEAVGVGLASALRDEDVFVPSYREQAAQLWRGVTPLEVLLYWAGDERGSDYAGPRRDFPVSITVGEHPPQAAGIALAMKIRRERRVVLCTVGDGATSKGSFYEAINGAGAMCLPLVTVVVNNGWAISAPRTLQSAAATLAQKAVAAGFPGEQVDGNDVVAVADVCRRAVERARAGEGPTLVEAVTYRLGDHTTVDDARRYRDDAEVSRQWELEPISRLRSHLVAAGVWTKEDEEGLLAACAAEIDRAAEEYLATPPLPPEAMFDHLCAELPPDVEAQRAEAVREAAARA